MSPVNNTTQECVMQSFVPGEPITPRFLLWMALVHFYFVTILGSLSNGMALWCVATCSKTRRPMKMLLFCVFVPLLLICILASPIVVVKLHGLIVCKPHTVSWAVQLAQLFAYSILSQIELASIAAVAVVRAVSVWSPHLRQLDICKTVILVVSICIYSIVSAVVLICMLIFGSKSLSSLTTILFFVNVTVPGLITVAAYALMIFAVQRNKHRMAAADHQARASSVMDQATRAMLAVFVSNLVFGLPHSIYHLMGVQPYYMNIIFHIIFSTHFVVDPLTFVFFNSGYRERVLEKLRQMGKSSSLSPSTSSFTQDSFTPPSTQPRQFLPHKQSPTDTTD